MPGGRWLKYLSIAALVLLEGVFSPLPAASHLDALYSQVLRRPSDTALNLEFARAAEQAGVLRWALSAYERVVVNDPGNVEAQTGLQRVRRKLQPNFSQVTVELGAAVETNPRYYLGPKRTEFEGLASATWRDERALNDIRWRTVGVVYGLGYSKSGELNYGYAGLNTGPVIDLSGGWSVVPMVGGTAAYFDHNFYYGEGSFMTTFEKTSPNAFQSLQLRAAYRSYDDHFPSGEGAYYDARLRLGFPNVLGYRTIVIFTPWILYSDIAGSFEFSIRPRHRYTAGGLYRRRR